MDAYDPRIYFLDAQDGLSIVNVLSSFVLKLFIET